MQKTHICSLLNAISVWSIILVPIVALLGFVPVAPLWIEGSKVLIGGILISISAIAYVLEGLFAGRFSLPHKQVLIGTGLYALSAVVSTWLVKGGQLSFFGIGVEAWTVTHIIISLLFFVLVSVHARNVLVRQRLVLVLVFGAIIATVFQLVRILSLGKIGSFSLFVDPVTNSVGRWFDIGMVSLILVLGSTAFFALKARTKLAQTLTVLVFVVSTVFFAIVSPLIGLILLALGALFLRNTVVSQAEDSSRKNIASKALLVVSVVVFAAFMFQGIAGRSPLFFQSVNVPTFSQTRTDIAYRDFPMTFISDSSTVLKSSFKESPIFGVGAARFQEAWAKYRPMSNNETAWWATDFGIGSGVIVTVTVMFGLLGLLGLLAFLIVVLRGLVQSLRSEQALERIAALFALILWIYAFIQTPSAGLMLVTFALTGISLSFKDGLTVSVTQGSHKAFAVIVAILVLVLPTYGVSSRALAISYAREAEQALSASPAKIEDASNALKKAVQLVPHEVYFQALATVQQRDLSDLYTKITNQETSETDRAALTTQFDAKLAETTETYTRAIQVNDKNYASYFRRAQFLSNFLGRADDASIFATALADVKRAHELAPTNAVIDILEAQLHLAKNNGDEAQKLLLAAINKKSNYTDAAIILAQLNIQKGNLKDALTAAEYAVRTNVNNSQALYVYGRLQFEAKNYLAAAQAFERIIAVEGGIPMELGRLLADSYAQIGALEQARQAYEELLKTDPNNAEIKANLLKIQEITSASQVAPAQ